jgi:hypothetical protein
MERKRMSNCDFCDSDLNTLGGATAPINDLTLSSMVVGNQEAMLSKLILILLFLYAYTNQNFISYLLCTNDKLINNQICLTDKMVDNLMDSLDDCRSELGKCCTKKGHSH